MRRVQARVPRAWSWGLESFAKQSRCEKSPATQRRVYFPAFLVLFFCFPLSVAEPPRPFPAGWLWAWSAVGQLTAGEKMVEESTGKLPGPEELPGASVGLGL